MLSVLGPKSWIFWWAGLTATAFLQTPLKQVGDFFKSNAVFSRNIPPFSWVPTVNGWIDAAAETLRANVTFDASKPIATLGPLAIPNWIFALLLGLIILGGALYFYSRALASSALLDDFVALFLLYFVIRIEAHLVSIANIAGMSKTAQSALGNQWFTFGIVMLFLVGLAITGEGLKNSRSFWRALLEVLIVAILIFPAEVGAWVGNGIAVISQFGVLLVQNQGFSLAWGLLGLLLAVQRLYYADAKA